jgi:hypothetical protein
MFRVLLLFGALVLAGCQTNAEHQAALESDLSARLERYNGASVAEFMSRTGMAPVDAYPVSEGRVFVFRTDPVYMTLPATSVTPAVTRSAQCQLLIRATNERKIGIADNWFIKGTQRSGPCNSLQV